MFLKMISKFGTELKIEATQQCFLLPGGQSVALGLMFSALVKFFVWPALFLNIPNYANVQSFLVYLVHSGV